MTTSSLGGTRDKRAQSGIYLSILSYLILSLIKCIAGIWAHSQAVFADGVNSISDTFLSLAILVGMLIAGQPADSNHPFGHRKAETIAALVAAMVMAMVAFHVWAKAAESMWKEVAMSVHPLAMWVSIGSAVAMFIVSAINFRLSRGAQSEALRASAYDNRSDAVISLGAFLGSAGAYHGLAWMDPLIAAIVGLVILHTAWKIAKPAVNALMDGFDQQRVQLFREKVYKVPGVREVRTLRARYHGSYIFVEVTIGVDAHLSVEKSHRLTERIEEALKATSDVTHVHVHVEPVEAT